MVKNSPNEVSSSVGLQLFRGNSNSKEGLQTKESTLYHQVCTAVEQ